MLNCLVISFSIILFVKCSSRDLPFYFPKCSANDPYLNNCIMDAFNTLKPHVKNGIKEINLPSLNPLSIEKFKVLQESAMVNYSLIGLNYTIQGVDNYQIREIRFDPKLNGKFHMKVDFYPIKMVSGYDIKGMFLDFPVAGRGSVTADYDVINATFDINGEIINSNGIEYYNPKNIDIGLKVFNGSYDFRGLFDNNEMLERVTNKMFNDNFQMITDAVTPVFEELSEEGVMRFIKSLFKSFPYRKLFPPS